MQVHAISPFSIQKPKNISNTLIAKTNLGPIEQQDVFERQGIANSIKECRKPTPKEFDVLPYYDDECAYDYTMYEEDRAYNKAIKLLNHHKVCFNDFFSYFRSIDFDKIALIAPSVKEYSEGEEALFTAFHFLMGDIILNKENLTLTDDFTDYLKTNFTNANSLENILIAYPLTERVVGDLPSKWYQNSSSKKETKKLVIEAFDNFEKEGSTANLKNRLEEILKEEVRICPIGEGVYGKTYKISFDTMPPVCLKVFKDNSTALNNFFGSCIEPQAGIFGNAHSNKLVKMFFGKVTTLKDNNAYIVTQYLADDIEPINTRKKEDKNYKFAYLDYSRTNILQGKIVDYGGIFFKEM